VCNVRRSDQASLPIWWLTKPSKRTAAPLRSTKSAACKGGIATPFQTSRAWPTLPERLERRHLALMKACGYCGGQNEEAAAHCSGCGTPFTTDGAWSLAQVANWTPRSSLGFALAKGLAALLIATGIYLAVGRACLDIYTVSHGRPPPGAGPFYSYFIWMPPTLSLFLSLVAATLIFIVCNARCRKRSHGITTAVATLSIAAFLKFAPGIWLLLLPAILFCGPNNSAVGCYIGATVQLAVGAWLLGWFGRRKKGE
jgi:hypothetical protein